MMKECIKVKIDDVIQPNTHLLIVWSEARHVLMEIEQSLLKKFKIDHRSEIQWSESLYHQNMSRFYGKKLPDISKKVEHCGTGPFVAYILTDSTPDWGLVDTSSGLQRVNLNMFKEKNELRKLSGGGHKIHATNNQSETLRDVSLIFGLEFPEISNQFSVIHRDITGAVSWASLTEFFSVMNFCVKYLVLRNFESLPEIHDATIHGDIDILCPDHHEFAALANAKSVFPQNYRRYHMINVDGDEIPVDIRDAYEGYYCYKWSMDILRNREQRKGVYVPNRRDHLYSLAYHALVHKKTASPDYCAELIEIFEHGEDKISHANEMGFLSDKVRSHMFSNGYSFTRPKDWSVLFNYSNVPEIRTPWFNLILSPPRTLRHLKREFKNIAFGYYHHRASQFTKSIIHLARSAGKIK